MQFHSIHDFHGPHDTNIPTVVSTTRPFDTFNATCTDSRVPGTQQPPSSYTNHGLFGVEFSGDETSDRKDPSKFTWYDRYVSQPMAWLVAIEEGGETKTSLVCASPREVQGGSRNPDNGTASKVGRKEVGWLGMVVVGVVMAVL